MLVRAKHLMGFPVTHSITFVRPNHSTRSFPRSIALLFLVVPGVERGVSFWRHVSLEGELEHGLPSWQPVSTFVASMSTLAMMCVITLWD